MKKTLLLLSIVAMRQIHGQTFVTIPDANFITYLQGIVPTAMSGNQMNTSSTAVTSYTQAINVSSLSIANLSGIQYFSSLTYLKCNNNSLTSLPTLPNSLVELDCESNSLTSLPALPNSLQTLKCYSNSLTSLPTLPNSLAYLDCSGNNISCFPTFPNSVLWYIGLDPNPYNCLPNHTPAMSSTDLVVPLCVAGNSNNCPVAVAGIEQLTFNNTQLTVYPNPTGDQFFIEANTTDKLNVDLYDVNGRHVFSASVNDKSNINVATLDNGIYTITIKSVDHVTNKKLVIVR